MANVDMKRIAFILGHMYGLNGGEGAPVVFMGAPGGGKTTLIKEFARRYKGGNMHTLPIPRIQGTDIAVPIPDHARKSVALYTSQELKELSATGGVLYLDEVTRPPDNSTNAAVLALLLEREVGSTDLRNCIVWGTCNPADQVGGVDLDPAYVNRVVLINWPENSGAESFIDHMNRTDAVTGASDTTDWPAADHTWRERWSNAWRESLDAISGFLRTQPAMLEEAPPTTMRAWRSNRSWHLAVNVLAACFLHRASRDEIRACLGGTIGEEAAHAFLVWRQNVDLPDPWDVISDKYDWTKRRSDEVFVIIAAAVDTWVNAFKKDPNDKRLDRAVFAKVLTRCEDKFPEVAYTQVSRCALKGAAMYNPGTASYAPEFKDLVTRVFKVVGMAA